MFNTVFLSIGSNVGNTIGNCKKAIHLIGINQDIRIAKSSSFYSTEPWGDIEQDWFTNCVIKIETSLSARELLVLLRQIEMALRREKGFKNLPRIIDIDILFFNSMINKETDLFIPHPLLHKRRFVLMPFVEIDPLFEHPVMNKTIAELHEELDDNKKVIRIEIPQ